MDFDFDRTKSHLADTTFIDQKIAELEAEANAAQAPVTPTLARHLTVTRAADFKPRPVVWAWDKILPAGQLAMAAGRAGTGKSTWASWLAARVTRGDLPGNMRGKPRNVFYVAVEDSWEETIVPRLMAAGADMSRVFRLGAWHIEQGDIEMSLPNDNLEFEAAITEYSVGLVVIDPVLSIMADSINANSDKEVRRALDPLAKIAHRTGCLILGIGHHNKSSLDPANALSGAQAFVAVPRAVLAFARDDEGDGDATHVFSLVKANLGPVGHSQAYKLEDVAIPTEWGPAESSRWVPLETSDKSVGDIMAGDEGGEASAAARFIRAYLDDFPDGMAPAAEVLKAGRKEGFSESTMKRARKKVADTVKDGYGGGWMWQIKGHSSAAAADAWVMPNAA